MVCCSLLLHAPNILTNYETIHSFPNTCKPLPTKICKIFWWNSEDNEISSITLNVYFDF